MVLPITAHPAFQKAAHLFDVKPVYVPFDPVTFRADVDALKAAINSNTILIVASAPQYPHGVVDPIEEIAEIALAHELPLHVDACIGGFMLPWVEALGRSVPVWDFRVKGVTSVSADIHKYGFCPKGASALVYSNAQIRMYQVCNAVLRESALLTLAVRRVRCLARRPLRVALPAGLKERRRDRRGVVLHVLFGT